MRFDVEGYLRRAGLGFRSSSSDHLVGKCWVCGKDGHLYINTRTGLWKCFSGKCEASGNLVSAVMAVEHVSREEAREIVLEQQMPLLPQFVSELHKRLKSASDKCRELIETPLPKEYVPCWNKERLLIPQYLRDRGVGVREIRVYRIGFCTQGRYTGRVILPVASPYGTSFTTRNMTEREPRYLAGQNAGRLLYGWDVCVREFPDTDVVVIVEGPFDTHAVHRAGLPVLGLMGKDIRKPQLEQLQTLDVEYVLLLDNEALASSVKEAATLRRVRVASLVGYKDPAVSSNRAIRSAVVRASPLDLAKVRVIQRRLNALRMSLRKR